MIVDVKPIDGVWDLGYSLDKHTISSTPIGHNEYGHMQFDTIRPEAGEALFQLKYRSDFDQVEIIASEMHRSLTGYFPFVSFVIPMPASRTRQKQPVTEIAKALAIKMCVPCFEEMLTKTKATPPMKDIGTREEKIETLEDAFELRENLAEGFYDALIVDDLYDTGSSLARILHKKERRNLKNPL